MSEAVSDSLHRQSEFYRSLTDRGIDPFAPTPDADIEYQWVDAQDKALPGFYYCDLSDAIADANYALRDDPAARLVERNGRGRGAIVREIVYNPDDAACDFCSERIGDHSEETLARCERGE